MENQKTDLVEKVFNNNSTASVCAGELELDQITLFTNNDILTVPNPFHFLIKEGKRVVKGLFLAFKDKKKLIPTIIFSVVWIVLILLPRIGINSKLVQILSFLTFAQGGLSNNVLRILGGLVGKGIYAYLVTSLIIPITRGKNPFRSIASGMKTTIEQYKNITTNLVDLLAGAGVAFIFYNFMAGYASLWKSMAAIAAMLLTLRALGSKSSSLNTFISLLLKRRKNHIIGTGGGQGIIAGMSAGFALSIPISTIPYVSICYVIGGVMIVSGIIIRIINGKKKEVKYS
ncbi:MAG: hypothetical protein ACYDEX_11200 [Mobilitalea sp.]